MDLKIFIKKCVSQRKKEVYFCGLGGTVMRPTDSTKLVS